MTDEVAESGLETDNAGTEEFQPLSMREEDESLDAVLTAVIKDAGKGSDSEEAKPAKAKRGKDATDAEGAGTEEDAETDETGDKRKTEDAPDKEPKPEDAKPDEQAIRAKDNWDSETKAAFESLATPEAKKAMLRLANNLEAGFTRKSQELSEKAKFADQIDTLFTPQDKAEMQQYGLSQADAVGKLAGYHRWFQTNPVEYAKFVIKSANIDPRSLFPQTQTGEDTAEQDDWVDPEIQTLKQQLGSLQQGLPQVLDQWWQQREQAQTATTAQTEVQRFASATDDVGAPRYPHFDRLRGVMSGLITNHPKFNNVESTTEKLAIAYDMAVRADPELGEQYLTSEVERRTKAQQAEAQKAASLEKAKRAAPVVRSSTAPGQHARATDDLDAILREVSAEVTGGRL